MSLEITIFDLKGIVKSGLEFFVLKFTESLKIPANLPFWADFFSLGSSNSEGAW